MTWFEFCCFLPHEAMLVWYTGMLLCVCPSVRPSQASIVSKRLDKLSLAWLPSSILCYSGPSKNKGTSGLRNSVPNSELRILSRQVNRVVNKTRRRSSVLTTLTTVDASRLDVDWTHMLYYTPVDRNAPSSSAYFDLLWICCTTCYYSCAAVDKLSTDIGIGRRAVVTDSRATSVLIPFTEKYSFCLWNLRNSMRQCRRTL